LQRFRIGTRIAVNDEREELVKVFVDLPNHWLWKGESMWARALGDDLYELRNSPFCAYGLNYRDVVLAKAESPSEKPRIRHVERSSGHRTLRFRFAAEVSRSDRDTMLAQLNKLGTTFEGHEYRFFSLDVPPVADYQAVCNQLFASRTCEQYVARPLRHAVKLAPLPQRNPWTYAFSIALLPSEAFLQYHCLGSQVFVHS
jgi:hypothetical protein